LSLGAAGLHPWCAQGHLCGSIPRRKACPPPSINAPLYNDAAPADNGCDNDNDNKKTCSVEIASSAGDAPDTAPPHVAHLEHLRERVGQLLGTSPWVRVDQRRINLFAEATGDHQWIHVDPVRAAQGPFGGPIAHGFLTLSLLPWMVEHALVIDDVGMGVNYGLNRVRFTAPVPAGSRVRGHFKLLAYEPLEGGAQLVMEVTMELEGSPKPVCVAESVSRRYVQAPRPP
jgi:acyl dehydratase